jgi:hypothetical protein
MPDHAATRHLDRPALGTLAVAGAVLVAGLVAAGLVARSRHGPSAPPAGPAFVALWRVHLLSSWSVDEVGERVTSSGATLRFQVHLAQRPPDSVEVASTTVSARRGSTVIACATPTGGDHPVCREAPATLTWQQHAEAELAVLRQAVTGPRSEYLVRALRPGCFEFRLRDPTFRPPANSAVSLGRHATYCLDVRTGAPLSSRVDTGTRVDTFTTTRVHAPATDADLALPAGAVYERSS